jgi:hypothetical protein
MTPVQADIDTGGELDRLVAAVDSTLVCADKHAPGVRLERMQTPLIDNTLYVAHARKALAAIAAARIPDASRSLSGKQPRRRGSGGDRLTDGVRGTTKVVAVSLPLMPRSCRLE